MWVYVCVCEKARERRHPSLTTIFNQTKAEQFIPHTDVFWAVLMLACWLMWTSHIYALPDEFWQFTTTLFPLSSIRYFLLIPYYVGTIHHRSQCGFSLLFSPLPSLSLVSSSLGSTPSGITPLQSTEPCSAGSARPDALQISSWVPCTHFLEGPLPQPPATLSRLSPPPASEIPSPSSCPLRTVRPTTAFLRKYKRLLKVLIFLYVKDLGSPRHNFASLPLLK